MRSFFRSGRCLQNYAMLNVNGLKIKLLLIVSDVIYNKSE